jgi:hypothetical protein
VINVGGEILGFASGNHAKGKHASRKNRNYLMKKDPLSAREEAMQLIRRALGPDRLGFGILGDCGVCLVLCTAVTLPQV